MDRTTKYGCDRKKLQLEGKYDSVFPILIHFEKVLS